MRRGGNHINNHKVDNDSGDDNADGDKDDEDDSVSDNIIMINFTALHQHLYFCENYNH